MEKTGFGWVLLAAGLYGLVHSFTASHTLKDWAERVLGAPARRFYRVAYILTALVLLVPLGLAARLLPDAPLYALPGFALPIALLLEGLAGLGLLAAVLQTGALSFLGLRQLGSVPPIRQPQQPGALVTGGLYRYVRHPIYSFSLVAIWAVPQASWNSFALMLGLTVYLLVGIYFEERKLLAEFGEAYRAYRERTPMLVPWVRR